MPNKTIFLNTINSLEKVAGFSIANRDELENKLKTAWEADATEGKSNFLDAYRGIFRAMLKSWIEKEAVDAHASKKLPSFQKCLVQMDESLKTCAMALIPALRENEDVLSNMTFGVMERAILQNEIKSASEKCLSREIHLAEVQKRKTAAYDKYKSAWAGTIVRNITELVRDKTALGLMSQEEKLEFALALEVYRDEGIGGRKFDEREKELINDALAAWKVEVGGKNFESLDEFVVNQYLEFAQNVASEERIADEIQGAIMEYNEKENPSKKEVEGYKKLEATTKKEKADKEKSNQYAEITDDAAEMVGDFFAQFELPQEITEIGSRKERKYLEDKLQAINKKYGMRLSTEKLRTSIEQVSALMIEAREEKEFFLSKDTVVVIENGVEKTYDAKEYFKEFIETANKEYADKIKELEEERNKIEQERKQVQDGENKKEANEKEGEDPFKERSEKLDKAFARAKLELDEALSAAQGGVVIEKDGDTFRQYKASEYYDIRETKKEQAAYGEYQKMFGRCYRDICTKMKAENYAVGKKTDFASIAKDIDGLFKTAMYVSEVYSNDRNMEVVQKCNFGGFSAEQLSSLAVDIEKDAWAINQSSEEAWSKQKEHAKNILAQWNKEERLTKNVLPANRVKNALADRQAAFQKGNISRKELLDYMIAADAHLQKNFGTRSQRIFGRKQYKLEKGALDSCRAALGLNKKDSLRVAMNSEYAKMAKSMSKEEIFKSIEKKANNVPSFQEEKENFAREHTNVQNKIKAEKQVALDKLKKEDREPIVVSSEDERKRIVSQKPRVQPVENAPNLQQSLQK